MRCVPYLKIPKEIEASARKPVGAGERRGEPDGVRGFAYPITAMAEADGGVRARTDAVVEFLAFWRSFSTQRHYVKDIRTWYGLKIL